jgi:hypothetical protein
VFGCNTSFVFNDLWVCIAKAGIGRVSETAYKITVLMADEKKKE